MKDPTCTLNILTPDDVRLESAEGRVFAAQTCHDALTKLAITRLDRLVTEYSDACAREDFELLGAFLFRVLFAGRAKEIHSNIDGTEQSTELKETLGEIIVREFEKFEKECNQATEAARNRRFRMNLLFEERAGDFAHYPWEFLYVTRQGHRGFFLAGQNRRLILTRFIPPLLQKAAPKDSLVLWIAWAQPSELRELLSIEELATNIERKLALNMEFHARRFPNVTWDDFKKALNHPEGRLPDIIHFVGHGQFVGDKSQVAFKATPSEISLKRARARPDESVGEAHWLDVADLSAQLTGRAPWLFFLHTCNSGRAGSNVEAFRSAAQQIARADVPFVISMQYEIANDDARIFAEEFYDKLGAGQSVDDAVKAGRWHLGSQSPAWGHRRFATPVVYIRSSEQNLLRLPALPPPAILCIWSRE
jgi:hypothetical protein